MCGIAGVAATGDVASARDAVEAMMATLERRGPDGGGIESWAAAVLGHRRLSIFDLSEAGRQPMLSPDGRVGVVFNGAIYNFIELREQLRERGYTFSSRTDTEVLVHGYDAWGVDGLVARLHGMFAFALWDDTDRTLYLVRDRLGVKPLLYAQYGSTLAFASTAGALRAGGFAGDTDDTAIAEFLEYGFVVEPRSIYRGVKKLPAAHILQYRSGEISQRCYWSLPSSDGNSRLNFDEAVGRTEELLLRAVEMRLQADVPVGALLSGGIDSTLVCWAVGKLGGDVTAFTVGTPGDEWDETRDAAATAHELGIAHRVLEALPEHSATVHDLVRAYSEPFACASALGMLAVSRAAKERATVLLTGDGGDDAFLGYPRHLHYALAQRVAKFTPAAAVPLWRSVRRTLPQGGAAGRIAHFVDYSMGGLGAVVAAHDGLPEYAHFGLAGERLRELRVPHRQMPWSLQSARELLDDFISYERGTRFVGEYLTKVDGSTMYHGVEARSPFLDQELWSFAASVPYGVRLHRGTLKAILREIARRNIGERVARGKKRGFGIPVQRWMTGKWREAVREAFEDSLLQRGGWIDSKAALALLRRLPEGETAPVQLWHLFVLESWMKAAAGAGNAPAHRLIA